MAAKKGGIPKEKKLRMNLSALEIKREKMELRSSPRTKFKNRGGMECLGEGPLRRGRGGGKGS